MAKRTPKSDFVKCQHGCCNELGNGNGGVMLLNANIGVVLIIGQKNMDLKIIQSFQQCRRCNLDYKHEPCMRCFPNFSHPKLLLNWTRRF